MVLELIAWIVPGSPTAPDCLLQTDADLFEVPAPAEPVPAPLLRTF